MLIVIGDYQVAKNSLKIQNKQSSSTVFKNQQLFFRVEIEWYQYQFVITKAQVIASVQNHVVAISRYLYQNYFH